MKVYTIISSIKLQTRLNKFMNPKIPSSFTDFKKMHSKYKISQHFLMKHRLNNHKNI